MAMRGTHGRAWTAAAAAVVALATVLGFAAPATATYSTNPISLPWHPSGPVHSSVAGNGVVYLGGRLDGTGGIAAISAATGNLLWQVSANGDVRALTLSPDGSTLYAGGKFTTVAGATHNHVVAIDVADHSVVSSWTGSAPRAVRDLVTHGNDVYVGGRTYTTASGGIKGGIEKLHATTGDKDTGFAFQVDHDVLGLALAGNLLILSGSFTHINGAPRNLLASIDLSTNTLTSWAPDKLCTSCDQYWDVQTDGVNAYVGTSGAGGFIGAYDLTTGTLAWSRIQAGGDVQALWLPGDGRLYLGGHFGFIHSGSQSAVATVLGAVFTANGHIDTSFLPKVYTKYPGCWTFTSTAGKLWVGGDFTGEQVNGKNNKMPFLIAYPDVPKDTQPPTGHYATNTATAWAGFTKVRLVQSQIHDNQTADDQIVRLVDWGDGTTTGWATGTTLSHVYQHRGTFTPLVTLTDQAGNRSDPLVSSTVAVKVDSVAPVVKLRLPHHQHSARAWRTLRGRATDAGTGVKTVSVTAVEKRGRTWYGYRPATHRWVKAATKGKAFARSRAVTVRVNAKHRWAAELTHLRTGTLVYRVRATDQVKNQSSAVAHRASLTRR